MMKIHHYVEQADDYFDEYADSLKYQLLKDRLIWQHQTRKEIQLEYQMFDDDCDFD
ncbi:hypothetical protein G6713_04890 [Polynucleobacter paneuropaeus]|nr:hypothetical protein G6713_04890 [Polynucleobacter paneuropaeus]